MKKLLLVLFFFLFFINSANSTEFNYNADFYEKRINIIGARLIHCNSLNSNIKFVLSDEDIVNAYADNTKTILVYKGLLKVIDGDNDVDELAAVLSHELGHIVNAHLDKRTPFIVLSSITQMAGSIVDSLFMNDALSDVNNTISDTTGNSNIQISTENAVNVVNTSVYNKISRKDEYEADLTGVDILVNAGFNPLAMITLLYKISDKNYVEFFQDHPTGINRIINCYDYIVYNYPNAIKIGYNNPSYQYAMNLIRQELNSRTDKDLKKIDKRQIEINKKKTRNYLQKR